MSYALNCIEVDMFLPPQSPTPIIPRLVVHQFSPIRRNLTFNEIPSPWIHAIETYESTAIPLLYLEDILDCIQPTRLRSPLVNCRFTKIPSLHSFLAGFLCRSDRHEHVLNVNSLESRIVVSRSERRLLTACASQRGNRPNQRA